MVLVYFLAPGWMKNTVLLLGSLIFYGWGEPKYLPVMAAVILAGYLSARLIGTCQNKRQSKILLSAAVLLEIFPLIYCKYADFFIQNLNVLTGQKIPLLSIAMPLGISFYTFQVISYTVDVYRGDVPAQKNLLTFAAYVAMFPQLVAGPIVRYSDIRSQLENRMHSVEKCAYGIRRFVTGLSKKILIANVLGELIGHFQASEEKSVLFFWMYAVAFMLQIYFDFSGYSDMAVGLGVVFGFDFPENFRYPYCSASITEFWRRWHISLGAWFRDYLYIPLGGSHVKPVRWIFNIFLVWMATGFWHGAAWNFILWGLMYAVLLLIEKAWLLPYLKKHKIVGHLYVLFFVLIGFVLFDASSVADFWNCIVSMFGGGQIKPVTTENLYYLKSYAVIILTAVIGATPLPARLYGRLQKKKGLKQTLDIAEILLLVMLLLLCVAFLVDGLVKNDVAIEHDMREVAMGQHRTLRTSRGARCVNDGEHVVRLDPGNDLIKGIVIDALSEIGDRVKTVRFEIEHVTQPFMHVTNLFERLRVDGISSEGNNRLHLFHDGSGLLGRIGFINRNAYRADGRACEIDHTPLVTGGRVNDHHASGFDSKTDKALRHGAHTSEHLACRHIMPLPSLIILPLCDKIIRILLRTTRQQRIYVQRLVAFI